MCGEIKPWQIQKSVSIRLTTSASNTTVTLPYQFQRVEEIRLDEFLFVGFNGGVSGVTYLNMRINGAASDCINNDNNQGTAIPVNVLTSHMIYNRPRVLQTAHGATVNDFQVRLEQSDGTLTTFTECLLVLTFVMRKSAAELADYRQQQAMLDIPQMKGVDPRSTYQGQNAGSN